MTRLAPDFLRLPLAHRALHDAASGCPENSMAAIHAAVQAGYGIEIDVQLTADGHAVVFHDYDTRRLTGQPGPIRQRTLAEACALDLTGGQGQHPPDLPQVLAAVAGQVPLLIEIKDQDGAMGPNVGQLEHAVADAVAHYDGPLAVMSFNPHSVAAFSARAPHVPRGLVTCSYDPAEWPLTADTCAALREIPDAERLGVDFISHEAADLDRPRVAGIAARGVPVLCWTIRSPQAETAARRHAVNITFEGYRPVVPA
ncbi:MAG: phosphodiesterase [Rhodobacteraceae bacterium]|nr:phosphodiesterase [Paracoccaceae bacterium]